MSVMADFNSKKWFSYIRKMADVYYDAANKAYVTFTDRIFDDIMEVYSARLRALKEEIYKGEDLAKHRIDRHKVAALYVQICLEKQVFKVQSAISAKNGADITVKLINEMFCVSIVKTVLESWNADKRLDAKKFKREYMSSFLRLLWHYRNKSEWYKRNEFFTYALAHAIYFIERDFIG